MFCLPVYADELTAEAPAARVANVAADTPAGQEAGERRAGYGQPAGGTRLAKDEHAEPAPAAGVTPEETVPAAAVDQKTVDDAGNDWTPSARDYDWVQLTSGEWLKGEIKSMYNDSLEFDSDKLDLLDIDWEDVRFLKSHGKIQVNFEGHAPVTGLLRISSDHVFISHDYDDEVYKRSELVSLSPAGEHEKDLWAIKFSIGLNVRRGNTDQVDYTSKLSVKRRTAKSRFITDYIGNISKTNAGEGPLVETINNNRINSWLDIYVSRYFYYTPANLEYFRDPFQNIDQRITAGVGIGYTIAKNTRMEWDISGGPSFLSTRYISVQQGDKQRVDTSALSLGTTLDTEVNSKLDFIFKYNIQAARADAGGYTHHMIATFESEITGQLDLDISLLWDRIGQPTENKDGQTPAQNDYRLIVGVTYTY